MILNEWLVFSLILLGIWTIMFLYKSSIRKEMWWASLLTAPFGLTEPLFVPSYWNPPSLFNLAANTGFDIESIIFSFAVGGIATALYETFIKVKHKNISKQEQKMSCHRYHKWAFASPFLAFIIFYFTIPLNAIYTSAMAMVVGAIATIWCRPDLWKKMLYGGLMFLGLYFVFFLSINLVYPGFVEQVWNLSALSGILILGIPIEELMFAITFGMLWSGIYEHYAWKKVEEIKT